MAGDPKHGDFAFNREAKAQWGLKRLFLHSTRLEFPHPEDGRKVVIEAKLPEDLVDVLKRAGLDWKPPVPHANGGEHSA